ncbi:ferredoxin--NADP reductase [uncultured Rubinisphaera sp.]|uniref:ferredoxin--NADP reductase n=1 Tax=uncultured Rubinisphaera sp. TaxID=1678686 RepID=UPI0030D830C8
MATTTTHQISSSSFDKLREQHYNATVVSVNRIHEMLMRIRIHSDEGRFEYQPGQYTVLALGAWEDRFDHPTEIEDEATLNKLIKRAYSISCPLLNEQHELVTCQDCVDLEFYITLVPRPDHESPKRPPLTPRLFALRKGDRLNMSHHVVGSYTLDPVGPDDNVIFAGTGTGEAPHNAMAAELLKRGHQGKIASMTCVRYRQDAGYLSEQAILNERYENYCYQLYTTREAENMDQSRPDFVGKQYLQDIIRPENFVREFGWHADPQKTHVFLCGNPDMIGIPRKGEDGELEYPPNPGMVELLVSQGFTLDQPKNPGNIHFEKYW